MTNHMQIEMLKSKIHRARLTDCNLNYEGSMSIDLDTMDAVGMLPYEKILVVNQNNGERLETYAIAAPRGSRCFCLNGAAARKGEPGDLVTIMAFASMPAQQARRFKPKLVLLDERNQIVRD